MQNFIIVIVVGLIAIIGFLVKKTRENSLLKTLHKIVRWCATEDSSFFRCNLHLWQYVSNAQIDLNLPQECRISTDEEWNMTKHIICGFQKYIVQEYLKGNVTIPTSKYVIHEESYFLYLLMEYLEKNQCQYSFLGYDMHEKTVEYKSYGSWGGQLFDATYSLTDFAVVFHKLYYISCMHCKDSKALNPKGTRYFNESAIEEIIKFRQISVSRF